MKGAGLSAARARSLRQTLALDDLLVTGRLGALKPGATRADVLAQLGPPSAHTYGNTVERASRWVYGDTGRGHLELSFLENDALVSIFSDQLPIRRHRCAYFRLDPGCLGGVVSPSSERVFAALEKRGVNAVLSPRDPQWSDSAPPPSELRRIPAGDWNKLCRTLDPKSLSETFHSEVKLPSGVLLGIGSARATLPTGEPVAKEDVVIVLSALMIR